MASWRWPRAASISQSKAYDNSAVRRYAIDSSFAKRELGWKPLHTAREGITTTVDWYLNNRSWWEPLLERAGRY